MPLHNRTFSYRLIISPFLFFPFHGQQIIIKTAGILVCSAGSSLASSSAAGMEVDGQSMMNKQTTERLGCSPTTSSPRNGNGIGNMSEPEQPVNRVNTTIRLQQLRSAMASAKLVRGAPLKAYIITSDDEHQVKFFIHSFIVTGYLQLHLTVSQTGT